jgi:geranylgeranyl pyrophosphate synthase
MGGVAYTREQAKTHVDNAKAKLVTFNRQPIREVMSDIADYALVRKA